MFKAMLCWLSILWAASWGLASDTLEIEASDEGAALEWQFPGVLQFALTLTNSWADLPQAVTSVTVPGDSSMFFRVCKPLFTVVDSAQTNCYNNSGVIAAPSPGQLFYGQDPQYAGPAPSYTNNGGSTPSGAYISFGRAMGYMNGSWMDVHGAGSQKSDLLAGNPASYPTGRGPQGDAVRIYNYVRLVRGGLKRNP